MSLADYLAKNYLTADPSSKKTSRKRKRKQAGPEEEGLTIADDDAPLDRTPRPRTGSDDDTPQIIGSSAEFRKKKTSGWTRVGAPAPRDAEQAEADRIIAQAAEENKNLAEEQDDGPVIEGSKEDLKEMEGYTDSGTRAGLQSSKEVAAAAERMKREERRRMKEALGEAGGETIYRDASGRIINVAMKRAEARRKVEEEERKKRAEEEGARGDVQGKMKEEAREKLKEAKYLTFARGKDDAELNEEMREAERWNDPAAGFVAVSKKKKSKSGRPLYQGPSMPNRFGIKPGYRWDGVDRSNGFEKRWFEARNRKKDMEDLKYAWQMDE